MLGSRRVHRRAGLALAAVLVSVLASVLAFGSPLAASAQSKTYQDPKNDVYRAGADTPSTGFGRGDLRRVKVTNGVKKVTAEIRLEQLRDDWFSIALIIDTKNGPGGPVYQMSFSRSSGPTVDRYDDLLDTSPEFIGYGDATLHFGGGGDDDLLTMSVPRSWLKGSADESTPKQVRVEVSVTTTEGEDVYVDLLNGGPLAENFAIEWTPWLKPAT